MPSLLNCLYSRLRCGIEVCSSSFHANLRCGIEVSSGNRSIQTNILLGLFLPVLPKKWKKLISSGGDKTSFFQWKKTPVGRNCQPCHRGIVTYLLRCSGELKLAQGALCNIHRFPGTMFCFFGFFF